MSTDFPIVDIDPFYNIYAALTRCVPGEGLMGTNPDDVLDIYQALNAYTYMGAYNMGLEDEIGSLEPGKKADIAVLNGRIIDEKPEQLLGKKAVLTVMDGRVVYRD